MQRFNGALHDLRMEIVGREGPFRRPVQVRGSVLTKGALSGRGH
jgi:hypothetical protein